MVVMTLEQLDVLIALLTVLKTVMLQNKKIYILTIENAFLLFSLGYFDNC